MPEDWMRVTLGELGVIKARLGWKGLMAHEYLEDGFVFLATPNLKGYEIDFDNVNYISKWRYEESPEIQLCEGDVLIVKDGSTLGTSNYVRRLPRPATVNGSIAVVRTKASINSEFLYHLVNGEVFQRLVLEKKSGLGVPHLFQADLREFPISVPPLGEQKCIAEILTSVDRTIKLTADALAKRQRVKNGLIKDLMTQGIDKHGIPRSEATHDFKNSPLGRIPVEWDVKALEEFAEVKGGKRLPAGHDYSEIDSGFRYLRVVDFFRKSVDYAQLKSLEENTFKALQRYEIFDGDLCVSIAGSIGHFALLRPPPDVRVILTENALRIKMDASKVVPEYLCSVLNSYWTQRQIDSEKGTGGGVPKLALFRVQSLQVAVPKSVGEQALISEKIAGLEKYLNAEKATIKKLKALKAALMQDLLTGKRRVSSLIEACQSG
jgi:type I restriction enzyme, S subunit